LKRAFVVVPFLPSTFMSFGTVQKEIYIFETNIRAMGGEINFGENELQNAAAKLKKTETVEKTHLPTKEEIDAEKTSE